MAWHERGGIAEIFPSRLGLRHFADHFTKTFILAGLVHPITAVVSQTFFSGMAGSVSPGLLPEDTYLPEMVYCAHFCPSGAAPFGHRDLGGTPGSVGAR